MQSPRKAHQACSPCKKHKRKCDKGLPACGLCTRTERACEYDESPRPPPSAEDFAALQDRITELEDCLSRTCGDSASVASFAPTSSSVTLTDNTQTTRFPSALFLDADCFEWAGMKIPSPTAMIPMDVLTILIQGNGILGIAQSYFNKIHFWMPFISKKRIELGTPFRDGGPDLAMLFLAMKLVTTPHEQTGSLYRTVRAFFRTLEDGSILSLPCLQAMILVALYEYSHSIYPAAWLTVGACSRYADIIGLSPSGRCSSAIGTNTTWTELEERRRIWWAIFILDRVISLGSRRRFSCPKPTETDVLPANDMAWDSGDVSGALQCAVSTPFSVPQSPFTRLCQSAMCICRAMECRRASHQVSTEQSITMTSTLTEDLCAVNAILDETASSSPGAEEYLNILAPRCLVWSALFLHLDSYCCPEKLGNEPGYPLTGNAKTPEEQLLQVNATLVVRSISDQAHYAALRIAQILDGCLQTQGNFRRISPFVLDALYCTMATFHWVLREGGDDTIRLSLQDVKKCLRGLGEGWPLALEYLALEDVYATAPADE